MRLSISATIILLISLVLATSCQTGSRSVRTHEKQEKKMERLEQKAYRDNIKEHEKMQSPQTRKMMKEAGKRSRKMNKYKMR